MEHSELIRFDTVSVRYKKALKIRGSAEEYALKDINLRVYKGETLGVIGKNGAGKSTLLRLLAGIIAPDEGVVQRNTESVLLLSLQVNFMPHLSGRENAIISGMLMGMERQGVERTMPRITEFSGLGAHIEDAVRTYSSGMKARLGFAVAQEADPEVLLIDEVLAVGDAAFKEKSRQALMKRIKSDRTVILVSHSEGTIKQLCDRVLWIHEGELKGEGEVKEIVDAYLEKSFQST